MDEIRRQDFRVFLQEFFAVPRLIFLAVSALVLYAICFARPIPWYGVFIAGLCLLTFIAALAAYNSSVSKRFVNRRYTALWSGCQDRLQRFSDVLRRCRRTEVGDLREMPVTVNRIAESLYIALRRADLVAHEVMRTERNLFAAPPAWSAAPVDPQSKELYRIADKNIAEYRSQYAGVMAGVERAEAQSAVFMTTLDTLRMKMLGYHLVGRSPEMPSQDFLEAINEAKLQLKAIDTALEELELGPYPKRISVMPEESSHAVIPSESLSDQLSRSKPPQTHGLDQPGRIEG